MEDLFDEINNIPEDNGETEDNETAETVKPAETDFSAISDIIEEAEKAKTAAENDSSRENTDDTEQSEISDGIKPAEEESFIKVSENSDSESKRFISKEKLGSIKGKIKDSGLLSSDMLKDMFFGSQNEEKHIKNGDAQPDEEDISGDTDEEEESQPILFDKSRKKRITADPKQDKRIFDFEYIVTPDQAADSYTLFYNEFIKPRNIKFTVLFGAAAAIFLVSALVSPKNYLSWLLLLISLSVIALMWLNSYNARKEAGLSADDVKNDSYKLTFYNSRILIEASELAGDRVYHYSPVMIRFEDIDLKVIDYDNLYVLIFKKDHIYAVPKDAMTEQMSTIFKNHLSNILGDDYREYYSRVAPQTGSSESSKASEEKSETERE